MIIDARDLPPGHRIDTDLCIVGGGAAGLTLASRLDGGRTPVCLLESGGLEFDPAAQALNEGVYVGEVPSLDAGYLTESRRRGLGGTTNIWGGYCRPLEPFDFEKRDWIPDSGWPIKHSDLKPWYDAASDFMGIGRFDRDNPDSAETASPLEGGGCTERVYRFKPTRFGEAYGQQMLDSRNVTVYLNASAIELVPSPGGEAVVELRAASPGRRPLTVRARRWVLATGGIENARLLLASGGSDRRGIGNDRDLVGRYFMEHSVLHQGMGPLFVWARYPMDRYRAHGEDDRRARFVYAGEDLTRRERLLTIWMSLEVAASNDMFSSFDRAVVHASLLVDSDVIPPTGDSPSAFHPIVACETAPNPNSRVTLGLQRDALGVPRVVLDWRLGGLEIETINRFADLMSRRVGELGLGRMKIAPQDGILKLLSPYSHHHMGTTRMSDDPSRGVVDADCRVHGVKNLWIAGSSVFPTSGASPPTFTIIALALRLAEHLGSDPGAGR